MKYNTFSVGPTFQVLNLLCNVYYVQGKAAGGHTHVHELSSAEAPTRAIAG